MPIYEVTQKQFRRIEEGEFKVSGLKERADLQRLLRTQISVIADDLFVLAEEFSEWEESKRRIDLLAIDAHANLVVVELKRTSDGGYMDLQAIRYAAMVSAITFERAVEIHAGFLRAIGDNAANAESRILGFLDWSEPDKETFGTQTRIILVSADFGKELTTSVLWLVEQGLDIKCVRMKPYRDGDRTLIDVQQIIPLPEASEYQIQLREKETEGRKQRAERFDIRRKFWEGLVAVARSRNTRHGNLKPTSHQWLGASSGIRGLGFNYVIVQDYSVVEVYIDRGDAAKNKDIFDRLYGRKDEIEGAFGGPLKWERLDLKRACRIKHVIELGGYRSPETQWPALQMEMVTAMSKLETALRPAIESLDL